MNFEKLTARVHTMTAYADTPVHPNRDNEYRRIYGYIEGVYECGGITGAQFLAIRRDVTDTWLMADDEDAKDVFLAGS
jgi:hypothetical protein